MFEINKKNARSWSRMGSRAMYGQALSAFAAMNSNVLAMSADLGRSSGLVRFSKEYPDQFINTGIAEQNMVGCAAGLARVGFDVFASTFAPFASMRASEQVRMNMGYMGEPVKLVALGSGLSMGFLGNSHYGLEDVAVMRTVPGLTIVAPADCAEIIKTIEALIGYDKPVYIRLTGAVSTPIVYDEEYDFEIGKAVWIDEPKEINLVSSGSSVGHCKGAVQMLKEKGFEVGLLNLHTIKPLDIDALNTCVKRSNMLITVEEHTLVGGLGSAVLDYVTQMGFQGQFSMHGINDSFVETGDYSYLLERNALDKAGIYAHVLSCIEGR
ncbi:transketolase family protein [Pseudopelagicola sp. nBUS_20]|uniref:transketolase family protein n=1 Tax=Pseudopelagicola sp. nBUS_20 TaxID=3395317 RepID=UPI003EBD4BE5